MSVAPSDPAERPCRAGHACCLYATRAEQHAALVPFLRARLERGDQCIHVAADTQATLSAMRDCGIDADDAIRRGALVVSQPGPLPHTVEFWREVCGSAASAGYPGLTVSSEMDGFVTAGIAPERMLDYEQCLNSLSAQASCFGLCLYDLNRISAEFVLSIILAHPEMVHCGAVFPNPLFGSGGRRPWALDPEDLARILRFLQPPDETAVEPAVTTLAEVTARLQDGNPQGIADLYGIFYRGAQFLFSRHVPAHEAGELAHAALCSAVQEIRRRDCDPDHLPRLIHELVRSQKDSRHTTPETPPDRRQAEAIIRVLSGFSPVDRTALIRHYFEGQTDAEVSSALGVTIRRLRWLKSKVRSAFEKSKMP